MDDKQDVVLTKEYRNCLNIPFFFSLQIPEMNTEDTSHLDFQSSLLIWKFSMGIL